MGRLATRVVFCSVVLLAFLAVSGQNPPTSTAAQAASADQGKRELTIEAIFAEGGITGRAPEGIKWSPDGQKISFVQRDDSGQHGELWYVDVSTGKRAVLVAESKLAALAPPLSSIKDERQKEWVQRYGVAAYHWAPDSKHLLFDARGQLWLYDLDKGVGVQITSSPDASSDPKFSPDGKTIAYVRNHNLWVRGLPDGTEKQLTTPPKDEADADTMLNGEVDWVYAEELDVRSNYFWSPNGKQIVFLQMNEKTVPTYPITDWMPQHPKVDQERYPKAGDPNPEVRLGVVDVPGGKVRWLKLTDDKDVYVPRFGWLRDGVVWAQVLNRAQDKLDLYFVDVSSGRSKPVMSESSDAWVDVRDDFKLLKSGDRFLWSSWRDGHTHVYLYSFDKSSPLAAEAKLTAQLTRGDFEVFEINGVDEETGTVFVTANADDPRQRQLFAVKLDGSGMQPVSKEAGTHSATFPDAAAKYYVDNYSAVMTPPRLSFCKIDGNCQPFWQARTVEAFNLIPPKFVEFKAADGTTTLYGSLLLPPGADSSSQKIPLIMNPYGGPSGQVVRHQWGGTTFLFHQIMAKRGFAILQVDNRGMNARGKAFAAASKRKFGQVELADQLAALDQALQRYPFLDANRLGWWGWSYGGYMTLYAMTHSDRFKAGVSVAPVTNWRDYDSIYTERYMGLPKDNEAGYADSSPVNAAKQLRGRVMIVHGTSDDNVHLQNTIQMIENLIKAGMQFDLQLYPNKTHGIAGTADRTHLFHRIQNHFEHELMGATTATTTAGGGR